ncbi:MAG: heterodisulfide reductase-related iron-sulfur binding cluster [Desulfobacterota bacterium]|nr:heterodisulfide reductase-related iron-sulfur binding cluster [Thermodesulfobacteriota bacterium]MDW8001115.1 heterodisulfide reductase-related iron-sulfur binding cluster [Deltaproteobacteria bacterium]
MEITREIFWNVGENARYLAYAFMGLTFFILGYGIYKRYKMWMIGKPSAFNFKNRLSERILYFIKNGIFHRTILREPYPGLMHLFLFWGFLILAIGTAIVAFQDDVLRPLFDINILKGKFYLAFSFILDLAGLFAIFGVLIALVRRYIERPERLDSKTDDLLSLIWILSVLLSGFFVEALRIAVQEADFEVWSFVGWNIAKAFKGAEKESIRSLHAFFWYLHMFLSFGLIAYVAYSKLLHIVTSSINMMIRGVEDTPKGAIAPIPDFETAEEFGVNKIENFTRNQLFDLDACTRCGRCQDVCPAYASEKPLSPKKFIQDLKAEWEKVAKGKKDEDGLLDRVISEETVWSCTACLACQVNCPISIPTFDKNIELRRYLTLTLSKTTPETRLLFKNLQQKYDPYGMGKRQRTEWIENLNIKNALEEEVEYLFWVGCVASLDDRNRKVAKAFVNILHKAQVSFGILGQEEACCGDPARRCGNEDLYLGIAQSNVELLKELKIKKIVTTCPHCYNTLKNEYPQIGGTFEVYHHSQLIWQLLRDQRLKISKATDELVTYHDPCYLGRVNRIYDDPRRIIEAVSTRGLVEMERHHDRSFCCGGGGGRIWMEEHHKRINHIRIEDAAKTNANILLTGCPYCLIMMEDAVKDKELSDRMRVLDLSELISGSIS